MGIEVDITAPNCPKCGNRMALGYAAPRLGAHPELRGYKCRPCREVITRTIDFPGARPWNGTERRMGPR